MLKYVKKFIFSKVAGLQTYSQQLKQMNSFTYIFQGFSLNFKNVVLSVSCSPYVLTQAPPSNFEDPSPPPMFSTPAPLLPIPPPPHVLNTCRKSCYYMSRFSLAWKPFYLFDQKVSVT